MTDRPTPEQIFDRASMWDIRDIGPQIILDDLKAAGYLIVHPDDVPPGQAGIIDVLPAEAATERIIGWDACRDLIFGDTP